MTPSPRLPTTWWTDRDTVVTQIAEWLYHRYSTEAVHEAVVSLLSRPTPPANPGGYCARVAWRYDHGDGPRRREYKRGLKHRPQLLDRVRVDAVQHRRLEARETLESLSYNQIMDGLNGEELNG